MIRRGHRNQLDTAHTDSFDPVDAFVHRPTDADDCAALDHPLGDCSQGFHVQVQGHRGKGFAKGLEGVHHTLGGQHHIEHQVDLGLQALQQAPDLGTQAMDAVGDGPGLYELSLIHI